MIAVPPAGAGDDVVAVETGDAGVVSYHRITLADWDSRNRKVSRSPSASRNCRRVTIVTTSPERSILMISARLMVTDDLGVSADTNTMWSATKAIWPFAA